MVMLSGKQDTESDGSSLGRPLASSTWLLPCRNFGCCVLASVVLYATLSASALAAPEWFQKGAVIKNNLSLTGESLALPEFTNAKFEIACVKNTMTGEIEKTNKVKKTTITFVGCSGKVPGMAACKVKSTGAGMEEIKTEELEGVLGEVAAAEAASERGVELKPVNAGKVFATIEGTCLPVSPEKITGNIIGEISPVKKEEKAFSLNFVLKGGKQEIREFKGAGGMNFLNAFGEEFPLESKNTVIFTIVEAGCVRVSKLEIT
jgi:hypothetical protein